MFEQITTRSYGCQLGNTFEVRSDNYFVPARFPAETSYVCPSHESFSYGYRLKMSRTVFSTRSQWSLLSVTHLICGGCSDQTFWRQLRVFEWKPTAAIIIVRRKQKLSSSIVKWRRTHRFGTSKIEKLINSEKELQSRFFELVYSWFLVESNVAANRIILLSNICTENVRKTYMEVLSNR